MLKWSTSGLSLSYPIRLPSVVYRHCPAERYSAPQIWLSQVCEPMPQMPSFCWRASVVFSKSAHVQFGGGSSTPAFLKASTSSTQHWEFDPRLTATSLPFTTPPLIAASATSRVSIVPLLT